MSDQKNENIFGTDGVRARVGSEPLTNRSLERLGNAIALWAQEKYGGTPTLLLGHDTRISSSFVKAALKTGLLRHAVRLVDAHILPTPAVVQLLQHTHGFDGGIVISASHNPYQDNGIKVIDSHGKLTQADEERISALYAYQLPETYSVLGAEIPYSAAYDHYQRYLATFFPENFLQGKKVVLDCAHGAAYQIAPRLFKAFGATTIVINDEPNGMNINKHAGALYPEVVQKEVLKHKADIGFSFDGDADRVIAVNRHGHIKNGDDILALLLAHPAYAHSTSVVGTVMTNQALEWYLGTQQRSLLRAKVGDKYVAQLMQAGDVMLGGEPSGHIILRDYLSTGDGIFVALRICQTLALLNCWDMLTFTKFPQVLINVAVQQRRDLHDPTIDAMIAQSRGLLCKGRLIVRYSGTEPLLRIMVEDDDYERALSIGTLLSRQLKELLS